MRQAALDRITPVLEVLRAHPALREARAATFFLDDEEFVHFHDHAGTVRADVLLASGRVSMPVSTEREQQDLLERIDAALSSLATKRVDRARRSRDRKARDARGGTRR